MQIENWNLYYKIHETDKHLTTTQMCYEPRVNPENTIFCMNFCYPCDYQKNQERLAYTKEHVEFTFQRELKYLEIFKDEPWAPEVIDIADHKIFLKWYGKTCNDSIHRDHDLNTNWYNDIESIILRQVDMGYLKSTMYPHCHYYDNNGIMRTIDFYATVEKSNPYLNRDDLIGLIGLDTDRFKNGAEGSTINIESIYKSGLLSYAKWPTNLTEIYNKIYNA